MVTVFCARKSQISKIFWLSCFSQSEWLKVGAGGKLGYYRCAGHSNFISLDRVCAGQEGQEMLLDGLNHLAPIATAILSLYLELAYLLRVTTGA